MKQNFVLKSNVDVEDLTRIHPNLLLLFAHINKYAYDNNLPVTVTSITGAAFGRRTRTHKEGRAIDVSLRGWPEEFIEDIELTFNKLFKNEAAISASDLKPRAIVVHDAGTGNHIHAQVRS